MLALGHLVSNSLKCLKEGRERRQGLCWIFFFDGPQLSHLEYECCLCQRILKTLRHTFSGRERRSIYSWIFFCLLFICWPIPHTTTFPCYFLLNMSGIRQVLPAFHHIIINIQGGKMVWMGKVGAVWQSGGIWTGWPIGSKDLSSSTEIINMIQHSQLFTWSHGKHVPQQASSSQYRSVAFIRITYWNPFLFLSLDLVFWKHRWNLKNDLWEHF